MIQDAGGVALADGRRMREGLVYRISGALAGPGELEQLTALGLKSIVDLRSEAEHRSAVIDWAARDNVAYWNFPIVVGGFAGTRDNEFVRAIQDGRHVEYLEYAYGELAVNFGAQLAGALERVADGFPSAFGCAAGKDRTGVMSAYLQILLGASEETAIESYLEKAPSLEQLRPQLMRLFGIGPDEEITEGMAYAMSVNDRNLIYAFERVGELGGVESFLSSHGLSAGAIERLRTALIED
jgi:protein-tyrosine phosphatase